MMGALSEYSRGVSGLEMMDTIINDGLDGAKRFKHERNYHVISSLVNASYQGAMKSILQSDRKPKEKNIAIMECLVEIQLANACLHDNINESYPADTVCGLEVGGGRWAR